MYFCTAFENLEIIYPCDGITEIAEYQKTLYLVSRINYANNIFSKLFKRGPKCINKAFQKSFLSKKFTFKTRIKMEKITFSFT